MQSPEDALAAARPHNHEPQPSAAANRPFVFLLLAGTAATFYLLRPFWSSLFLAATLAVATYPMYERASRLMGGRRQLAGLLLTLCLFSFLIAPLASMVAVGVREVTLGLAWARDNLGIQSLGQLTADTMPPKLEAALANVTRHLHITAADLQQYLGRALEFVQSVAPTALTASMSAASSTLLVLAAYYFFTVDGERLVRFLVLVSPLDSNQTDELFEEFRNVSSAALVGTVVTSAIIGGVVSLGFLAVGIPHAIFFGMATTLAGFIPVVGSAIVWVPAGVILLLMSRVGAGVGLLVWCTLGVAIADNVIKPLLMRGKSEIHMGLMFLALLGGLAMFGGTGIIAGPVLMAAFLALLRIYARDYVGSARHRMLQ